jgi:hypothetical protein
VIIALVMVGLIAFMGLAIDGGNLFWQRRRAQNAADSSAMAGTRVLARAICDGADSVTADAAVLSAIHEFAEANGVENPSDNVQAGYLDWELNGLGLVGAAGIPGGATAISVTLGYEYPTYFVTVVGIGTAGASAEALAATGPATALTGLRPFGLPKEYVGPMNNPWDPDNPTAAKFSICFGVQCDEPDVCTVEWTSEGETASGPHRGWMNFNCVWNKGDFTRLPGYKKGTPVCEGAGSSTLTDWMLDGWNGGTVYADGPWTPDKAIHYGDFVHSWPGVEMSTIRDSLDIGEPFFVPIYDAFPEYEAIGLAKPGGCSSGGNEYYHIVGFAQVEVFEVDTPNHCIIGEVQKAITAQGLSSLEAMGGFGDPNACRTGVQAVNLYK